MQFRLLSAGLPLALGLTLVSGISSGAALANGRSMAPVNLDSGKSSVVTTAGRTRSVSPAAQTGKQNAEVAMDPAKKRSVAPVKSTATQQTLLATED